MMYVHVNEPPSPSENPAKRIYMQKLVVLASSDNENVGM